LIYGETGTGKELIARAVHNLSSRKSNAFVKLNCAAIPTGLLESELFGHEKGAFTGAISQRVGRFELAHRGTIFLDEVGEISLELQPKLLRVLQEREFERLGSTRTLRTDARLIAATNRDLKTMVGEQKFRPDLYYRLNVFPIRVPALRERKEDIPLLVRHFVQQFSQRNNRVINTIPSETMEALVRYHWPGNIRELQNVIERAVILSKGTMLNVSLAGLEPDVKPTAIHAATKDTPSEHKRLQDILDETEQIEILRALEASDGIIAGPSGAAARLGVKRSTLQLRMQRLGIRLSRTPLADRGRMGT
jgi:formate hydrogenlyase transcriptional activator